MEIYAAMVEHMDDQIGRLFDHLKKSGQYDNTLIIFMSDNGANGEDHAELLLQHAPQVRPWFEKTYDNRFENWGRRGSFIDYGPAWGQVSNVPFRLFKGSVAEGGIRAPLIVSGPGVKHEGTINHSALHIMDITPTLLELAGVEHPAKKEGSELAPPQGKSMWPLLAGREQAIRTDSGLARLGIVREPGHPAIGLETPVPAERGRRYRRLAVVQPQGRPRRDARSFPAASRETRCDAQALGGVPQGQRRHRVRRRPICEA